MDALKLATTLEKFASFVDETEGARQREAAAVAAARVEKIANQYRENLGSGFTDEMRKKLASLGDAELSIIEKMAAASSAPESLGGAADGSSPFTSNSGSADPMAEFTRTYSGPAR